MMAVALDVLPVCSMDGDLPRGTLIPFVRHFFCVNSRLIYRVEREKGLLNEKPVEASKGKKQSNKRYQRLL